MHGSSWILNPMWRRLTTLWRQHRRWCEPWMLFRPESAWTCGVFYPDFQQYILSPPTTSISRRATMGTLVSVVSVRVSPSFRRQEMAAPLSSNGHASAAGSEILLERLSDRSSDITPSCQPVFVFSQKDWEARNRGVLLRYPSLCSCCGGVKATKLLLLKKSVQGYSKRLQCSTFKRWAQKIGNYLPTIGSSPSKRNKTSTIYRCFTLTTEPTIPIQPPQKKRISIQWCLQKKLVYSYFLKWVLELKNVHTSHCTVKE